MTVVTDRARCLALAAPSGKPFLFVLDTAAADAAVAGDAMLDNARCLSIGTRWRTAALTLGDEPSLELLDNPPSSGAHLAGYTSSVVQLR